MELDLRVVEITHDDLVRAVGAVAAATGRRNPMDVAIAVPLYLAAEAAATDGIDRLAVGQGADELFGGYSKVVNPAGDDRVAAETVRAHGLRPSGRFRNSSIATCSRPRRRVEPVAPLLDDRLVAAALALPGELLASDDERKVAPAAGGNRSSAGVGPDGRQEGGPVRHVRLARDRPARAAAGFKRRMDDHVGQYLDALLAEQ